MEDYFYFTMRNEESGEVEFIGDVAKHWWKSWEKAVEFSNMFNQMPDKSEWKICGDHLIASAPSLLDVGSNTTIQLRNTGYEEWLKS